MVEVMRKRQQKLIGHCVKIGKKGFYKKYAFLKSDVGQNSVGKSKDTNQISRHVSAYKCIKLTYDEIARMSSCCRV